MFQVENFRGIMCHESKGGAKLRGKLTQRLKNDIRIWLIFMSAVEIKFAL